MFLYVHIYIMLLNIILCDIVYWCFLFFFYVAANEIPTKALSLVKEQAISSCITALSSYRKFCATVTSAGQLILPEALKLLPLYTLGTSLSLNFTILLWFAECNIIEQKL